MGVPKKIMGYQKKMGVAKKSGGSKKIWGYQKNLRVQKKFGGTKKNSKKNSIQI